MFRISTSFYGNVNAVAPMTARETDFSGIAETSSDFGLSRNASIALTALSENSGFCSLPVSKGKRDFNCDTVSARD